MSICSLSTCSSLLRRLKIRLRRFVYAEVRAFYVFRYNNFVQVYFNTFYVATSDQQGVGRQSASLRLGGSRLRRGPPAFGGSKRRNVSLVDKCFSCTTDVATIFRLGIKGRDVGPIAPPINWRGVRCDFSESQSLRGAQKVATSTRL